MEVRVRTTGGAEARAGGLSPSSARPHEQAHSRRGGWVRLAVPQSPDGPLIAPPPPNRDYKKWDKIVDDINSDDDSEELSKKARVCVAGISADYPEHPAWSPDYRQP